MLDLIIAKNKLSTEGAVPYYKQLLIKYKE